MFDHPNKGERARRARQVVSEAVRRIILAPAEDCDLLSAVTDRPERAAEAAAKLCARMPDSRHGPWWFPPFSGIASSCNPYVWSEYIEPEAGVVRLAAGLGTRFADRSGDDFTRTVALGAPARRPETTPEEIVQNSQRQVDVVHLERGRLESVHFLDLLRERPELARLPLSAEYSPAGRPVRALTFDPLLSQTTFLADLADLLSVLHLAANRPVELEFAADLAEGMCCRFALLDCRSVDRVPLDDPDARAPVFSAAGAVLGRGRRIRVDRVVYVAPEPYGRLPLRERYDVARLIGRVNGAAGPGRVLYLGPGRWCTSSPELGVPVSFAEINRAAAVGEIVAMHEDLVPEVSRGAHLLNELVALDILYLAIFPGREHDAVDDGLLRGGVNHIAEIVPAPGPLEEVLRVLEVRDLAPAGELVIAADPVIGRARGFIAPARGAG